MARPNVSPNPPPVVSADDKTKILQILSNDTGKTIRTRLAKLTPKIILEDYIALNDTFKSAPTTLEGVSFIPVNCTELYNKINCSVDPNGQRTFTDPEEVNLHNLPQKISMLATKGTGFREIWRAFPANPIDFKPVRQPWETPKIDLRFSEQFGSRPIKLNITSLHWAVSPDLCNIHIDEGGFTIQVDDDLITGPDAIQHILNELILHDKLQGVLPEALKKVVRRINLIYPSTANGFSRWGPTVDVYGHKIPLPGVSFDLWQGRTFKVEFAFTCGVSDATCSKTISVSGVF